MTARSRTPSRFVIGKRILRSRPLVLVADDDVDARRIYRQYLRAMGCRVLTAADGRMAVRVASDSRPDIVVMDLAMPYMDGWEATRILKKRSATSQIPIIAISALSSVRDSARAVGCDAYLAKPCLPELVWCEIRVVLQDAGLMWGEMTSRRASDTSTSG